MTYSAFWDAIVLVWLAKLAACAASLTLSVRHLTAHPSQVLYQYTGRVFIVVPLLREQARINALITSMSSLVPFLPGAVLALVTTERERAERLDASVPLTAEVVAARLEVPDTGAIRIVHIHYPHNNRVMSEQLNYAVGELLAKWGQLQEDPIFIIYNADSLVDGFTGSAWARVIQSGAQIAQQSALFMRNAAELMSRGRFFMVADALHQSRWTIQHEIPRYLVSSREVAIFPESLGEVLFAHCVGHGLMIRGSTLAALGGFPEPRLGLEDSTLGLAAQTLGYRVVPLGVLENADAPTGFREMWAQKVRWFLGPFGIGEYASAIAGRGDSRLRAQWLSLQGMFAAAKWALSGPFVALTLVIASSVGAAFAGLALYLGYCYVPVVVTILLARRCLGGVRDLPAGSLCASLVAYPLVPLVHSCAGLWALAYWGSHRLLGRSFRQQKTE